MRCTVKKTLQIARETGNDVIVQVKANQPTLLQGLEQIVATRTPVAVHDSTHRARNRREDRHVHVYDTATALKGTEWETLVAAMVCVHRQTLMRSAATGLWAQREEASFYISSVMLPAETFAHAIRGHWAVENKNHWAEHARGPVPQRGMGWQAEGRDVTMTEDASRIRIHPGIMARLRSQALNIARANGVTNIAAALWQNAIDPELTLSYRGL
jgi:predicted transposase YbfD/YdcC